MPQEIVMPRLSDTMEEGTVSRWLKQEGDEVHKGEILAEIETDKATMELQSYSDGVLSKILVQEGTTVPLGAPIGTISKPGESNGADKAPSGKSDGAAKPAEPKAEAATKPRADSEAKPKAEAAAKPEADTPERAQDATAEPGDSETADSSSAAPPLPEGEGRGEGVRNRQPAPEGTDASTSEPSPTPASASGEATAQAQSDATSATGVAEDPEQSDGKQASAPPSGAAPRADSARPPAADADGELLRASPVARRMAEEHGIDLAQLADRGSGPSGRIVQVDVERYLQERQGQPAEAAQPAARGDAETGEAQPASATAAAPSADVELRQVGRIHQVMARRTLESVRDVPQYYLTAEVDMAAALDLRRQLQAALGDEGKVSINDLVIRAAALALREVPEVNSSWQDGQLALHRRVNVGVAVAVPDGLIVPVVHDADAKTVRQIGAAVRQLAARAREGKVTPQDVQGATFTVSNLGMFDVEEFHGILNPPEAGLLAVGTVVERPVGVDGRVVLRPRMRASLTCDHRAYSGDVGARFLQAFTRLLQEPLRLGF